MTAQIVYVHQHKLALKKICGLQIKKRDDLKVWKDVTDLREALNLKA